MTGLSLNEADRLALAAAGVAEHADGSLRSASGSIVSPGVAAALISRGDSLGKDQAQPAMSGISPDQFHRGYIVAGHASDSPANRRRAAPVPPEGGGRSSSLCTTPDDASGPGDVEKVVSPGFRQVEPEDVDRGYLQAGHASPSPADRPGNSPVSPDTGSGHARYQVGVTAYEGNQQASRAERVTPSQCIASQPASSRWSPPPDLGASNVPQPRAAGATGRAPGE